MTRIALIVPCLNEAAAMPTLFAQIAEHLPEATVHIFDNASTDGTPDVARGFGATVHRVAERGKGHVVSRMFADVDADIYLMIDGDATYDLSEVRQHVRMLTEERIDMLVGTRIDNYRDSQSRPGHQFGNLLLTRLLGWLFNRRFADVLSGYRLMSRRFVKTAPILARGFEVETTLSVHALEIRCHVVEAPIRYLKRAEGSQSKLRTLRDGLRIVNTMFYLLKEVRPFLFFSVVGAALASLSLAVGIPVVEEFFRTGLVPRFPSAILAAALMLSALISATCGLILDSVASQRRELKRLFFLRQAGG